MLVDANILLYSVDGTSQHHLASSEWLTAALNGMRRVGIPWLSLVAFVRIATNPRATNNPLTAAEAWQIVENWIDAPAAWIPQTGPAHRTILGRLLTENNLTGGLVADAVLAALCIEHGLEIVSADSDFARFAELTWINPTAD